LQRKFRLYKNGGKKRRGRDSRISRADAKPQLLTAEKMHRISELDQGGGI
jgi:hypothetical protein